MSASARSRRRQPAAGECARRVRLPEIRFRRKPAAVKVATSVASQPPDVPRPDDLHGEEPAALSGDLHIAGRLRRIDED